jgi:hypothetical protein
VLGDITQEDLQKKIKLKSKHLSQRFGEDNIEGSVQNTHWKSKTQSHYKNSTSRISHWCNNLYS